MELPIDIQLLAIELRGLDVELDIKRQQHILLVREIVKLERARDHIFGLIEEVRNGQAS